MCEEGWSFFSEVGEGDALAETCWREGASCPEAVGGSLGGGRASAPAQCTQASARCQPAWKGVSVESKRWCHRGAREQTCRAFRDIVKTLKIMSRVMTSSWKLLSTVVTWQNLYFKINCDIEDDEVLVILVMPFIEHMLYTKHFKCIISFNLSNAQLYITCIMYYNSFMYYESAHCGCSQRTHEAETTQWTTSDLPTVTQVVHGRARLHKI